MTDDDDVSRAFGSAAAPDWPYEQVLWCGKGRPVAWHDGAIGSCVMGLVTCVFVGAFASVDGMKYMGVEIFSQKSRGCVPYPRSGRFRSEVRKVIRVEKAMKEFEMRSKYGTGSVGDAGEANVRGENPLRTIKFRPLPRSRKTERVRPLKTIYLVSPPRPADLS